MDLNWLALIIVAIISSITSIYVERRKENGRIKNLNVKQVEKTIQQDIKVVS